MRKQTNKILQLCCLLLFFQQIAMAQQRTITGTVVDSHSETLVGVAIQVKGTTVGTITDADGKFSLAVSADAKTLLVRYVGMQPLEVAIKGSVVNVTLQDEVNNLDEFVVVGYGVQKKSDLTGSVTSLRSKDITALPSANALESMQGKIAGMDMNKSSGQLGGAVNFSLRGNRSLTASNAPLILVDGVAYGSTLDINPSDIESMEVLKDASSTAIYGSRGANGVILITTKSGKEGKTKVSFSAYTGVSQVTGQPQIMSGPEYVDFKREAYRTQNITDDTKIFAPDELDYMNKGYYTDWGDLVIKKGQKQNYELSVSGGTKATSVSFSLGYRTEEGLFRNEALKRYNFRLSADHQLYKNLKMGANILYTYKDNDQRRDPLNAANKLVPISRPYDDEGNFILYPAPGYTTQMNPMADEQPNMYVNNVQSKRMFATGYVNWTINNDFFFKTTVGADMNDNRRGWYYGKNSIDGGGNHSQSGVEVGDNVVRSPTSQPYGTGNGINLTWENVLNYTKDINKHSIQALLGNSMLSYKNESYGASGKDQVSEINEFYNLGSNSSEYMIGSNLRASSMMSFFGRVNYKYDNKYLLSISMRADGSSTLAPGHQWGYFPSIALGWRLKQESFLKDVDWLQDLKLRLSCGQSGNSAISPYQTEGNLSKTTYAFGEVPAYGYAPSSLANKDLTWETTTNNNIGVDFGFFNGRISGSVDAYIANTKNLLMARAIASSSGFTSAMDNVGKTKNTGVELVLRTVNLSAKSAVQWNSDITVTHNKEEIVALAGGVQRDEANAWFVGSPTQVWYDYKKIGIWQTDEALEAAKNGQKPGDIKVETNNADGKVTTSDRQILGTLRPKISFGFNNTVTYKGIDFSVFVYGKFGQMIKTDAVGDFHIDGLNNGIKTNYWTPENPSNDYPRPDKGKSDAGTLYHSTLSYIDGSFWKIRNITLGYTLPENIVRKASMSSVRFYATVSNYFTFCDSRLAPYDPERNLSGSTTTSFPMSKEVVFGVNINF